MAKDTPKKLCFFVFFFFNKGKEKRIPHRQRYPQSQNLAPSYRGDGQDHNPPPLIHLGPTSLPRFLKPIPISYFCGSERMELFKINPILFMEGATCF